MKLFNATLTFNWFHTHFLISRDAGTNVNPHRNLYEQSKHWTRHDCVCVCVFYLNYTILQTKQWRERRYGRGRNIWPARADDRMAESIVYTIDK